MPTRAEKTASERAACRRPGWACVLIVLATGCGSPSSANIELRKQNQDLQDQITPLTRAREADAGTIASLQQRIGTIPTLPQERLEKLFGESRINCRRESDGGFNR